MSRAVAAALLLLAGPSLAQEPLNLCVALEKGDALSMYVDEFKDGGPWPNNDVKNRIYASVRGIPTVEERQGCDAVVLVKHIDSFWNDHDTEDILSGATGQVLYRGPAEGWNTGHSWNPLEETAADELKPGGNSYNAIQNEKVALCHSAAPPDTPLCRQIADQERQQRENARRYAAEQTVRSEQAVRERIPAWRALKNKLPLPEAARKYRLLAEDAVNEKNFENADKYYSQALAIEPLWPEGQFNLALIDGELRKYAEAASHMRLYLEMVPDAADAQGARDKVTVWEEKAK